MLISFGYPRLFNAACGREGEEWLYLAHDLHYVLAVSPSCVQLWSAGMQRVLLSQVLRSEAEMQAEGPSVAAYWCSRKASLAVLVSAFRGGRLNTAWGACRRRRRQHASLALQEGA